MHFSVNHPIRCIIKNLTFICMLQNIPSYYIYEQSNNFPLSLRVNLIRFSIGIIASIVNLIMLCTRRWKRSKSDLYILLQSSNSNFSIETLTLTTQWPELALHRWQLVGKNNVYGTAPTAFLHILVASSTSARKDFDLQLKLELIYWPRKD